MKLFSALSRHLGVFAVLTCALLVFSVEAYAKPIRVVDSNDGLPSYAKGLLKLALSKLPEKYELDESTKNNTEGRVIQMIDENLLDVCFFATTNEFEERMRPIRIPMLKGLLGYRVLMIKKGDQSKFDGIRSIEDLKRVSLGSGRAWADTDVLVANNLKVVKVLKYDGMFFMLDGGRFDAFPRGAHEPWAEIAKRPTLELDVEKNLLLVYPNPYYFFVNKNNIELARNIEKGLRIAMEDGSFDQYFLNDPAVKDVLEKANLKNRTIIQLKNPTLPKATPVDDKNLWFDPYSL